MALRIAVIVEGHGEDTAVRSLLQRVWYEHLNGDALDVLRPLRKPQGQLLQETGLKKAVDAAKIDLDRRPPDEFNKLVIILIDSEGKPPCQLAPQLLQWATEARSDADIACILPHHMFETWFAAAAASLAGQNDLPADLVAPVEPEKNGLGKGWLKKQLPRKYIETIDQAHFVGRMDLQQCRQNSPSFDKLCRELEKRLPPHSDSTSETPPE
jgi:Domain of unknown function (DUF4276)